MSDRIPDYDDIVVRVVPMRHGRVEQARAGDVAALATEAGSRAYEARVYTTLPEFGRRAHRRPESDDALSGLPLVAVEEIVVRWGRYAEYLAAFLEGEKAESAMRERMFEALSPGLELLLGDRLPSDRPIRVWWSSASPELEELPWELLAYGGRGRADDRLSFVRGLPPATPPPTVPLDGELRLALVHGRHRPPDALRRALAYLPGIEVTPVTGRLRDALERVAAEGHELLHIVADGRVSLACEGVLDLSERHGKGLVAGEQDGQLCSPSELSALLRGSRVSVLGLTPPGGRHARVAEIGRRVAPTAYRAYVHLGGTSSPLPSVVAPVGPLPPERGARFWREFYGGLAETLGLEAAMARARARVLSPAMALFLRHPLPRLFRRHAAQRPATAAPTRLEAELQLSQELVRRLEALEIAAYPSSSVSGASSSSVAEFIREETAHQRRLSADLDPWRRSEEG